MSTTSSPTADEVRIVNYVLGSVSIAATLFRLFDRTRTRRLWWDDAWAGIAMIVAVMFMVAAELHLQDPAKHSRNAKIIIYYFCAQCFSGIIWSARISILFTIMRLTVPGTVRKLLWTAVCLFGLTWFILFAQVWWVCESQPGWKNEPATQCDLGRDVAIAQVITDVLSDAILIIAPMKLIWRVKLTQSQKIRLIAIFSTTGITTAVSLYHAYFVLRNGGLKEALAAVIEDGVSLIVVNLSVLIAFFFRITTESQSMRSRGTNVSDPKHTAVSITRTTDRVRDSLGISIVDISKPALEPETPTIKLDTFGQHDTGYDFKSPSPGL